MDDAGERGNDAAKKIAQLAAGDQNIVDVQQHLQAVALLGKFFLVRLRGLEIESVVHGDSNLRGDALHELNIGIRNSPRTQPPKAHRAEPVLGRGEREGGKGANALVTQPPKKFLKAR